MYNRDIYYEIIKESINIDDNQKYIQEIYTIITEQEQQLSKVHSELNRLIASDKNNSSTRDTVDRLMKHVENEYKMNYELINKLYYVKHKTNLPENINNSLKAYCFLVVLMREIVIYPDRYKSIVGENYNEFLELRKEILKLMDNDKNTAIHLSKMFIVKIGDIVKETNDEKIKESYSKLMNKINSSIISEDVKMESIREFLKDLYRLPYKVIMKPFAKLCYSFVIYASRVVNKMLSPFISLINKVTHFFQVYLPKKIVNILTKQGIIKNPLVGTMIEMGFKIVVPVGLNVSLFFLNTFSPRAAMITSFISTMFSLSKTIVSVNVATETVNSINEVTSFLSSFVL